MLALVLGACVPARAQTGERVFDALTDLLRGGNPSPRTSEPSGARGSGYERIQKD